MSVDNKSVIVCWLLHLVVKTLIIITQFLIIYCDEQFVYEFLSFYLLGCAFASFSFVRLQKFSDLFKPNE